jgi:hypothetical protein
MQHAQYTMLFATIAVVLFLALVATMEVGRRMGVRAGERRGADARVGVGIVDASIYSVLGLLLGFTFSGAAGRFEHRRELVIEEVGKISSAWKRIDLLGDELEPAVREPFRRYVDALLAANAVPAGSSEELHARKDAAAAQQDLWHRAVEACVTPAGEPARVLLLPLLTEMFHAAEAERLAQRLHPPVMVWVMLGVAALASSLFIGYAVASGSVRSWLHVAGASATFATVVFVILELETPRLGLVRVDAIDEAIVELRATME